VDVILLGLAVPIGWLLVLEYGLIGGALALVATYTLQLVVYFTLGVWVMVTARKVGLAAQAAAGIPPPPPRKGLRR
jgi:hypothetical protein